MSQPFTSPGLLLARRQQEQLGVLVDPGCWDRAVTWGKDSPLQLAQLQWMPCKPLAVAGTFPKAVKWAFLSIPDDWKEPGSCRSFQHGPWAHWEAGLGGTEELPVHPSHPARENPKKTQMSLSTLIL